MKGKKIVILTGAGISAESGVRTFRDNDGLWENHRIEDVARGNKGAISITQTSIEMINQTAQFH